MACRKETDDQHEKSAGTSTCFLLCGGTVGRFSWFPVALITLGELRSAFLFYTTGLSQ